MINLIKITEASNLAVHALAYLATHSGPALSSASEIARHLGVSEAHMAKVLQRLARHHLIRSTRGAKGGFVLSKNPQEIRLMDVLQVIDGPISGSGCLLGQPLCKPGLCLFAGLSETIRTHLERKTIADFRRKRRTPRR